MLYIIGTAIGNIEDTTYRAVKTLSICDIILTEDTASFDSYYTRVRKLYNVQLEKKQHIVHLHKENEFEKLPWVLKQLEDKQIIGLVSESGLPGISDPGRLIIERALKSNHPFTVVPGPTAFATAAVLSGFSTDQILFLGFLPKKENEIIKILENLTSRKTKLYNPTIVFYESPHRIQKTLAIINKLLPDAELAIVREMTKKFEEVMRDKPSILKNILFKGELTVVLTLSTSKSFLN